MTKLHCWLFSNLLQSTFLSYCETHSQTLHPITLSKAVYASSSCLSSHCANMSWSGLCYVERISLSLPQNHWRELSKWTPTLQWTMFEPGSALWWPPRLCWPIRWGLLWTCHPCAPMPTWGISVCKWKVSASQPCLRWMAGLWLCWWIWWAR